MTTNHHTPIAIGAPANASTFNTPLGQLDSVIDTALNDASSASTTANNLKSGADGFTQLNLSTTTTLTIATGAVTATRSRHLVDTEASASYDDLDTINGGSAGDVLVLQSLTSARVVVVRHGTGNIFLNGDDVHLDNPRKALTLLYDGTQWVLIGNPPERIDRKQARINFAEGGSAGVGLPAFTTSGTATVSMQTDGAYTQYASTAVIDALTGLNSASPQFTQMRHNPKLVVWLRTGSVITNSRWIIGLHNGVSPLFPVDDNYVTAGTQVLIFRYSTYSGDTGFRPVTCNGTTQTVGTAMNTLAPNTAYKLAIWVVNGVAYFAINDGAPVTVTTTLPASTSDLSWNLRIRTLDAVSKSVLYKQVLFEVN